MSFMSTTIYVNIQAARQTAFSSALKRAICKTKPGQVHYRIRGHRPTITNIASRKRAMLGPPASLRRT